MACSVLLPGSEPAGGAGTGCAEPVNVGSPGLLPAAGAVSRLWPAWLAWAAWARAWAEVPASAMLAASARHTPAAGHRRRRARGPAGDSPSTARHAVNRCRLLFIVRPSFG